MGFMRKALFLALVALAFPAGALASVGKQYVLRHPKRERCKAHYVKRVEHGKTWCVRLTPTYLAIDASAGAPEVNVMGVEVNVMGFLYTGTRNHEGARLLGQPIRFTITDATTGQPLGSFAGVSFAACTLRRTVNAQDTIQTLAAEAIAPYPACALPAPVSLPAADEYGFTGAFAGSSTYAPTHGEGL
jgi:hypothetical protein